MYLQAVTSDLSVGVELALKTQYGDTAGTAAAMYPYQPAIMAQYVGATYQMSGKVRPTMETVWLAYYQHINDRLQAGVTFTMDSSRSKAITRLAFRGLTDTSVFRATVGTDGGVGSLWEKRLNDRVTISTSLAINYVFKTYTMGIGLSFEWPNKF